MATVHFTSQLERFLDAPTSQVEGRMLSEVFASMFSTNQRLSGYIVDDQGALRQHVAVFIDGKPVTDRQYLSDDVGPNSEVYVFQALSGG